MATLVVGQSGRYVGRETVGVAGAAPAYVPGPTRVTIPQAPTAALEFAGYALLFTSALMPAANTIAAAEYQVGTHQAAIAASQDRSWVRGTPFTLIPVAGGDTILRPLLVAAPQQREHAYALTFDPPLSYLAVIVPPPATLVAAPQQVDGAYSLTFRLPQSYLAVVRPLAATLFSDVPAESDRQAWIRGTSPDLFPAVAGDVPPPTTIVSDVGFDTTVPSWVHWTPPELIPTVEEEVIGPRGGDDSPDSDYWRKKREESRLALEEGQRRRHERDIPQVETPEPAPLLTEPVGPIIGELVLASAPPELELLATPPMTVSGRPILHLKRRETDDEDDDETVLLMVS